ncbi:MAG: hypothetical protein AB7S74_06860 [Hyphomicrobium sp.]
MNFITAFQIAAETNYFFFFAAAFLAGAFLAAFFAALAIGCRPSVVASFGAVVRLDSIVFFEPQALW